MEIVKCRNSKHSNRSHYYRIIKGFGVIIEGNDEHRDKTKKITKNIPNILSANLENRLAKIPRAAKDRIQYSLTRLTDKDFEKIDLSYLVDEILEDYSEMESSQ